MSKLSTEVCSYLAGVMDGDGSFSIIKHNSKCNPWYYPFLQFANKRKSVIDLLSSTFGGNIIKGKQYKTKGCEFGNRIYLWRLRNHDDVKFMLRQLIPFLRIKRKRAEFLLDFVDNFNFIRGYKLTDKVLEKRESARLKMMDLNCWRSASNLLISNTARKNTEKSGFWAYVAGVMDTDGSFSVKKQIRNKGTHVINPRYLPVISISFIDTRALNYIKENCSLGKVYNPKNKSTSSGFHYQFGIYSRKGCSEFIKNILPFLVGKKENAKALLEFCEGAKNTKYCKAGISSEELAFRDGCYRKLVSLNKYGVYKPSLMDLKLSAGKAGDNKAEPSVKSRTVNVVSGKALHEE